MQPGVVDLEDFGRRLMAQRDSKVDSELARIRQESSGAIGALTQEMQSQLRNRRRQLTQLSEQVQEGQAHVERVRLQVEAIGRMADARPAQISKLSSVVEHMLTTPRPARRRWKRMEGAAAPQAKSAPKVAPRNVDQPDPKVLQANADRCGLKARAPMHGAALVVSYYGAGGRA